MKTVHPLLPARWIIPVEPDGAALDHHSLAIRDGRILAILPSAAARRRYTPRGLIQLPAAAPVPARRACGGGRTLAPLPSAAARSRYTARDIIELPTHALIPGLVNAHTHAAMSLFRGLADDLPLMDWRAQAL